MIATCSMSSFNGHHAVGGPSPGGQASFHPGAYSNISSLPPLRDTQHPSQHMGSSQSSPVSSPSSVASFKGLSAAVAGGIGIKRVFATRRKKSEDLFPKSAEHDLRSSPPSSSSAPQVTHYFNYALYHETYVSLFTGT